MKCRLCQGKTIPFLSLGKTPPPEAFLRKNERPPKLYPLGLSYCSSCKHVQLIKQIPKDIMYKKYYFYDYATTKTGMENWRYLASLLFKRFKLIPADLILDIGSNTGAFLSLLKNKHIKIIGVDPATKLVKLARKKDIPTIDAYFSEKIAKKISKKYKKAKVITCTNTFDHVENLDTFMQGLRILLSQDGIFIVEVPYFKTMITKLTHLPYHQQVDYMLLTPLLPFFKRHGLEIIDAEEISLHGGSIRIFVQHKGLKKPSGRLQNLLAEEKLLLKDWPRKLEKFASNIQRQRNDLMGLIKKLKKDGKQIAAIGASAKGHTLLNYSKLGPKHISFITEKSPLKVDLFTPSGIPIVADEKLIQSHPDYALLLSWNFAGEIMGNLKAYKKSGGKFIIPIPTSTIV